MKIVMVRNLANTFLNHRGTEKNKRKPPRARVSVVKGFVRPLSDDYTEN